MTSTKEISINEIITTFQGSISECKTADLKQFVVAMVSDATPMRITGDEVRIVGKAIYSAAFSRDAQHIAGGINKQFIAMGSTTRVQVETSSEWRVRRVAQLEAMIATIQQALPNAKQNEMAKQMVHLSANEHKALRVAFKSSKGNGHDFGFVGDIVKGMRPMKAQAVGAIVTSLQAKGLIEVHEPVVTNDGGKGNTFTQFTWATPISNIEMIISH